jgi:hypothetical protein
MISVSLFGGLGNMMFQIAMIESFGQETGFDVCYPTFRDALENISQYYHSPNAKDFTCIFKNFRWDKNIDKPYRPSKSIQVPFKYVYFTITDNTNYSGYFQSEKYFPDRDFILRLFEPADYIKKRLENYNTEDVCSIHIRRGDFLTPNNTTEILEMDYYCEALLKVDARKFFIFSDDHAWCRERFKGDRYTFIRDINYVELFLMSRCRENIIANSSFSWWGSYLNNHPERRIIAPHKWTNTPQVPAQDIYREEWIIV